ncbi:MAG: hypothetical protein SFX18_12265 [Pirellulales bacterium]|nr:hypothetical protein [Pirellulales bacterium]
MESYTAMLGAIYDTSDPRLLHLGPPFLDVGEMVKQGVDILPSWNWQLLLREIANTKELQGETILNDALRIVERELGKRFGIEGEAAAEPANGDPAPNVRFSDDCHSVNWHGEVLTFSTTQAVAMRVLKDSQGTVLVRKVVGDDAGKQRVAAGVIMLQGQTQNISGAADDVKPLDLLFGWREIIAALGRPYSKEEIRRIKKLSNSTVGPIPSPGKGGQICCERGKLLEWWNRLEKRHDELQQRNIDRDATTSGHYDYGQRGLQIIPEIAGAVKKQKKAKESKR